jgi:zinc transport system substrate-binding protein
MQRSVLVATLVGLAATAFVSCSRESRDPKSENGADAKKGKPVVYASTYPLQYFAERIGGGKIEVRAVVPVGEDAEHYIPDDETIKGLQKADLVLINGALLEKWLMRIAFLPESRVVDTSRPFEADYITLADTVTHSHGPKGANTHEGAVAQTWLDPKQAAAQAGEVAKALSGLLPDGKSWTNRNLAGLQADLGEIDRGFAELFKEHKERGGRHFLFSRPVYEYLARRYELNATSLQVEPNETPDDETFESIKRLLKTRPAEYIVWEADPAEEIAGRFRDELSLESACFETCTARTQEQVDGGMNYLAVMARNLENLRPVFAARE